MMKLVQLLVALFSLTTTVPVDARQTRPTPTNYTNDLYHCFLAASQQLSNQPNAITDDSVLCDFNSYQWVIDSLNPDKAPDRCVNFDVLTANADLTDDVLEPCILWHMQYGALAASSVPSTAPSKKDTPAPSKKDTSAPSKKDTVAPSAARTTVISAAPSTVAPSTVAPSTVAPSTATPSTAAPGKCPGVYPFQLTDVLLF